ncbi:MAG: ubiquinone biosynthesis accessory factor UbiJ [Porticoccaceae bacterium]
MIFSTLQAGALSGLELAINSALKYDPATLRELSTLEGQVLLLDCTSPAMRIAVQISQQQITLYSGWEDEAAITLQGSLIALAKMAANASDTSSFAGTGVQLSGNLETLHKLHKILSQLDIDWEGALADIIGDIPAYMIGSALRKSADIAKQNKQRVTSALTEVAQEELQIVPSRNGFEQFKKEVREMASDTDRLMARTNLLRQQIDQMLNGQTKP